MLVHSTSLHLGTIASTPAPRCGWKLAGGLTFVAVSAIAGAFAVVNHPVALAARATIGGQVVVSGMTFAGGQVAFGAAAALAAAIAIAFFVSYFRCGSGTSVPSPPPPPPPPQQPVASPLGASNPQGGQSSPLNASDLVNQAGKLRQVVEPPKNKEEKGGVLGAAMSAVPLFHNGGAGDSSEFI